MSNSLAANSNSQSDFDAFKQRIHQRLIGKLDLNRIGELEGDVLKREIRMVVEHLCDNENTLLNRSERDRLVDEVLDETFGLGPLELLLKDPTISDILFPAHSNSIPADPAREGAYRSRSQTASMPSASSCFCIPEPYYRCVPRSSSKSSIVDKTQSPAIDLSRTL